MTPSTVKKRPGTKGRAPGFAARIFAVAAGVYAAVCAFVWFGVQFIPVGQVLVSIAGEALCDVIWLPLGIGGWTFLFATVAGRVHVSRVPGRLLAVGAATFLVLAFPAVAFRGMAVPVVFIAAWCMWACFRPGWRRIAIPVLAAVVLFAIFYRSQLLPDITPDTAGTHLSVLSYNIRFPADQDERNRALEVIRKADADIVCLTEYNPRSDYHRFIVPLIDRYHYISNRDTTGWNSGEAILSKYPVEKVAGSWIGHSSYLAGRVDVGDTSVIVMQLHLSRVIEHVKGIGDILSPLPGALDSVYNALSIVERLSDSRKQEEADRILEVLDGLPGPVIVCGDFNTTPNSTTYDRFAARYTDAFHSAGWGLGVTFGEAWVREWLPGNTFWTLFVHDLLRIDYGFVGEGLEAVDCEVITSARASDHKPVLTIVVLPDSS